MKVFWDNVRLHVPFLHLGWSSRFLFELYQMSRESIPCATWHVGVEGFDFLLLLD